jgi:hypothetical protein
MQHIQRFKPHCFTIFQNVALLAMFELIWTWGLQFALERTYAHRLGKPVSLRRCVGHSITKTYINGLIAHFAFYVQLNHRSFSTSYPKVAEGSMVDEQLEDHFLQRHLQPLVRDPGKWNKWCYDVLKQSKRASMTSPLKPTSSSAYVTRSSSLV